MYEAVHTQAKEVRIRTNTIVCTKSCTKKAFAIREVIYMAKFVNQNKPLFENEMETGL